MAENKTDYTKPRTDLVELLPEPLQSDVNLSIFDNVFNRYLTKQEIEKVAGYIGRGNPNALRSRQIHETDVHRQAYQLQPIPYSKIGSVEYMTSWKDMQNELERLGVDIGDFDDWGATQKFNWVPPIDINKIINYRDYYWVDSDEPNSKPQYITIRNTCTTAIARFIFWERLTIQYGATMPFDDLLPTTVIPTTFIITGFPTTNTLQIVGNITEEILLGDSIEIVDTISNDGVYFVNAAPTYSGVTNETTVQVSTTLIAGSPVASNAKLVIRQFNKVVLNANSTLESGDYTGLYEEGFIFFVRNSTNTDLNNVFVEVIESTYDSLLKQTTVTINHRVTDNTADGEASLEEQLSIYETDKMCQCGEGSPLSCDVYPYITATTQWISQNHWLHKTDVENLAGATRACLPIIEYDCDIELNEWTFINYNWSYRAKDNNEFVSSSLKPPKIELEPLIWWEHGTGDAHTIVFDDRYGDLTDYFIGGRQVSFVDNLLNSTYTVVSSFYKTSDAVISGDNEMPYRTFVVFDKTPPTFTSSGSVVIENLSVPSPNAVSIIPLDTIHGDIWEEYGIHWRFDGADDSVPVPHQSLNPYMEIDDTQTPTAVYDTGSPVVLQYEYITSTYAQNYLLSQPTTEFQLTNIIATVEGVPITSRPLTRRALFGYDDMRVYASDFVGEEVIREFGTYDEIGEVVFDIRGVDFLNNKFRIGDGSLSNLEVMTLFNPGDIIRISDNISIGTQDFTVVSASGEFITVLESIPTEILEYDFSGNIINITTPVRPEDGIDTLSNTFTFTNAESITVYVIGIEFPTARAAGTNIRIIVGASSIDEIGTGNVKVTTTSSVQSISTTKYRIVEQIKTKINQYPLFDVFDVEGFPAYKTSSIFGYRTSSDSTINQSVGLRIVHNTVDDIYEFDQFLLEGDDGELFAYRDYTNKQNDYWYNKETAELKFWDDFYWSDKTTMSEYYRRAIVSSVEPNGDDLLIDGLYWYNTVTDTLFRRFAGNMSWVEIPEVDHLVTDANLQTIWKAGKNNDLYVPDEVDWKRRSETIYAAERDVYVSTRVEEIVSDTISEEDAKSLALTEWYEKQTNHISPTGTWIGDWEIPDPLYYNHLHENRKYLSSRDLFAHFTAIINGQPAIPGWSGTKGGQFNIVNINDINYGVGGTIKEFNNGFDTLISSVMVNNVTPPSLFEFAYDQYEVLLNTIKEIYRQNSIELLTDLSTENILNVSPALADTIIEMYELNTNTAYLYGDSTTFTDNAGVNDVGIRNWIATLPSLNIVHRVLPERIVDHTLRLNEVVHHDGHRGSYEVTPATADILSKTIINSLDPRINNETLGTESTQQPAKNIADFTTAFNTIINREGVYWYYTSPSPSTLYRYVVVASGAVEPPTTYVDGTLWMDLAPGLEVLRILYTDSLDNKSWDVVNGLTIGDGRLHNGTDPSDISTATISAWRLTDLNVILGDIIFELENRLYENAAESSVLDYDFGATKAVHESKYLQYTYEAFLVYVSQSEIKEPFKNNKFNPADPFTWNYKHSAIGGSIAILSTDELTNSFVVSSNRTSTFTTSTQFYVKNSSINDGSWVVISSIYDNIALSTTIYVEGDVKNDTSGIIYTGMLPSPIDDTYPNNLNDGSESGGDWRHLYEEHYGTPYPHLEPWTLQGYSSKPTWWDAEYLNDDISKWGNRTWKYKHGFDIVAFENTLGSPSIFSLTINDEFNDVFVSGLLYSIDNSTVPQFYVAVSRLETIQSVIFADAGLSSFSVTDDGFASTTYTQGMKISIVDLFNNIVRSYTIKDTNLVGTDFTIVVEEEILVGDIAIGSDSINGAIYTPTTNETVIYTNSQITLGTSPVDGRIALAYGMWENIRTGTIPPGRVYPNGAVSVTGNPSTEIGLSVEALPILNYFSVNIDNATVSSDGGIIQYASDTILPPYWDSTVMYGTILPASIDNMVRSLYTNFNSEIISPNANYLFNDRGPVEWEWKTSSRWLYDQLTIAYRLDPSRFIYSVFGFNFTTIGGLLIDRDVRNTASHIRTNFHGDVVDGEQFISNGINQWYVNFNRYAGYDINFSDFQSLWTLWSAPLTYQFASHIDAPSLSVGHRYVELTNLDYNITSKRSLGLDDFWLDALDVQILNIPHDIVRYNNQLDWRFEVKTNITQSRKIEYYDVHNYQFLVDTTTNECSIYTWNIEAVNLFDNKFMIIGDLEDIFVPNRQFVILDSSGNDGIYTISFVSYDVVSKLTTIMVDDTIPSFLADGKIKLEYRNLPWDTGYSIYLSTAETMPIPLNSDTVIGTIKYFIIKTSSTTFKVANTYEDALEGIEIPLTTQGTGDHYVGELYSVFKTSGSDEKLWRQYALDETNVLSFSTPKQIQGMQHWIDIVRGYDALTVANGWVINADRASRDPDTDKVITWQIEIERFINYAYNTRTRRAKFNNKYVVVVDVTTDEFTFVSDNRVFITGDPVILLSSNAIYPSPFTPGLTYYVIRDELETFKLAASRTDAQTGIAIDIQLTAGVGELAILTPTEGRFLIPSFEMNPFRNAVWFRPPSGIVSNIITGPSDDIRTSQLIFDQNGDTIHVDQLRVYRRDTETKIVIKDGANSTPEVSFVNDDYNFLHLGGLHIFTDSYEHVMMLNNYSIGENLLYDSFIGLNVTKYEMLFNRNPEFTGRPNIGGYYLETFFNQGANIKENFEAGVENLRNAYDTYNALESNLMTTQSRNTLGYNGTEEYLIDLNISEKSQFIFWRGQIQNKGSINAFNAYINSRRFIDAKLDEFWAIKVADFGSSKEKEYPEMFTTTIDARTNEFKVEFISSEDEGLGVNEGFTAVRMSDTDRWYNQPEQLEVLRNNSKIMYFDMKIINKLDGSGSPSLIEIDSNGYIVHNLDVDVVEVTTLGEAVGFEYINPNIIKMTGSPLPAPTDLTIWGYVVNNDAQNPSSLIDRGSETQLSAIEFWDPARGHHYSLAIHNVDLQNHNDPAVYASTPQTITDTRIWASKYIGTSWMDTSTMDYAPYHSNKVITNDSVRFREWGQLYDYASINLYEWVESDVPPSEWDAIAETEEGNNTIPEADRKAGVAKFTLFEPEFAGSPVTSWIPLKNKVDTQNAATDATSFITYNPDTSILDDTKTMDVYRNGTRYDTDAPVAEYEVTSAKENDIIKFVQAVPTDPDEIAAEIAAGNLKQEYEYTTIQEYDSFGTLSSKYYFWVGNKGTKPLDRNRLMSLAEAQQQLVSVPSTYMFFQKPLTEEVIADSGNLVPRVEYYINDTILVGSPQSIQVVEYIATNTIVTVTIDGIAVAANDISYVADGTSKLVTINVPFWTGNPATNEEVRISYVGIYTSTLPNRFSQVIVRGLQGIVFDDSRYTIRFNRDFTLRDNLDVDNEEVGPLDLNNLHEEWKIFRKEQETKIDRWMWNKITESIVGYLLTDPTIRVPSYEYELYDEKYETDTQYGIGVNQSFVNGTLALSSIVAYLEDPDVSFTPVDINTFFNNYNFDTEENIITAMDNIYNTFSGVNINRIYFSVLFDAFTTKAKYPGIFKTSMVSLHGIRPFIENGIFDE